MAADVLVQCQDYLRDATDCGELLEGWKALADIFQVILHSQEDEASQAFSSS